MDKFQTGIVLRLFVAVLGLGACVEKLSGQEPEAFSAGGASDYTVKITGHAPGAEGREIVWRADADMFTHLLEELGRARIGEDGRFELYTAQVSGIRSTYLLIDYYATGLIVEAGKEYRLQMGAFDYYWDEQNNAFIVSGQLPGLSYVLQNADGNTDTLDRNYLLGRYTFLYNRMMARNFEAVSIRGDTRPVQDFLHLSDSLFGGVRDTFFQAYRAYTEAGLKAFAKLSTRKELYREYIENRAIDACNPAQMAFLKTYYLDYFSTNRFVPVRQIKRILNRKDISDKTRLEMLSDSLGLDYSLRNEKLREWLLIHACSEVMGREDWNTEHIRSMLHYLSQHSKFPLHAQAVSNLLLWQERMENRHYFTGVTLRDTARNVLSIDSLLEEGKFHYFVFVRADYERCPTCGQEADRLKKVWNALSKNEQTAVRIIFINCDYAYSRYYFDAQKQCYPWPYLHFNGNIDWIRQIDAARFPAFMLVDDRGNVLDANFNAPSRNIEEVFKKMARLKARREQQKNDSTDTR